MNRLTEELLYVVPMAPQSVASGTLTASGYVDVSDVSEIMFQVSAGAITNGKSLTVQLFASDASDGTDAVKIAEKTFTAAASIPSAVAAVSYQPSALHGRYVAVKIQQDTGSAVICAVTASMRQRMIPAGNAWTMQV